MGTVTHRTPPLLDTDTSCSLCTGCKDSFILDCLKYSMLRPSSPPPTLLRMISSSSMSLTFRFPTSPLAETPLGSETVNTVNSESTALLLTNTRLQTLSEHKLEDQHVPVQAEPC